MATPARGVPFMSNEPHAEEFTNICYCFHRKIEEVEKDVRNRNKSGSHHVVGHPFGLM
jgi:hypothetical protein